MKTILQIPITKGNYARLQAVADILKVSPEELFNNALMKVMEGPEEMPFLSRWERHALTPIAKQPKNVQAMVEKLTVLGHDGWRCEPLT